MTPTHMVQILLPLYDNSHENLPRELFDAVRNELSQKFGGLTAYTQAPAEGLWREGTTEPSRDDIVIYEVMTQHLDTTWWSNYRRELETRFRQQHVVVRSQIIQLL